MLYPVFLNLKDRQCLVVGGGSVAEHKIKRLWQAGASICLVAPSISDNLLTFLNLNQIEFKQREYQKSDLNNCLLIFALTNQETVNQRIALDSRNECKWCNLADENENISFLVPTVVDRGLLQIAISTGGASPSLSKKIKDFFESLIVKGLDKEIFDLKKARQKFIKMKGLDDLQKKEKSKSELAISIQAFFDKLFVK